MTVTLFGVRTAWHGPQNVSPVGHAVNMHLDYVSNNFGIQEEMLFTDEVKEIFPGTPQIIKGYTYSNGKPGLGIDIDEKLAAQVSLYYTWVDSYRTKSRWLAPKTLSSKEPDAVASHARRCDCRDRRT